ncbi:putative Phage integrase [Paraburkholderia piptadeniae]|uniref:Phage integrase n=1 Tax=Paraburkholderia piptadeniae TaxID=1701573 RepID=A0A1N7SRG3_9BURK|nr:site-specific integrase [Paraburkholderia piptadeniae]SIT50038.1 putative Phage integrase [Paraburkholderia piptadeniae]
MKHPYLAPRRGSSNYYFRRKIPLELQSLLQRKDFWLSLETPSKEVAITRLPLAALEFERLIAPARAAADAAAATCDSWLPHSLRPADDDEPHPYHPTAQPPGTTRLSAVQIPRLVERYTVNALANDDETRPTYFKKKSDEVEAEAEAEGKDKDDYDDEAHRSLLLEARQQLRRARASDDFSDVRESVEEHLTWERAWLPAASTEFVTLLRAITDAQLAVVEEELRRLEGKVSETPELIPLVDEDDTWEAALKCWKAERMPSPKTVNDVTRQVQRFKSHVGNLPLSVLTPDHVERFKTLCLEKDEVEHGRVNTILSLLSPLVTLAMRKKLTKLASTPFSGMKYPAKVVERNRKTVRTAFTIEQLNAIFASPVCTHGHRPGKGGGEAAYWLPLLGPHTGARVEDLCRLTVADMVQRDGAWCFHLHDSKRESRTGNRTVMRHVPVHRNLRRLGWLDYVESRRPAGGSAWLFPDLSTNQYGKRGAVFSNWFNAYLRSPIGLTDPALVYHSFRHTFQTFGELAGISGHVIDELIGHAPDSRYGRKEGRFKRLPFELLVQAMEKLDFPGLELGHLMHRT